MKTRENNVSVLPKTKNGIKTTLFDAVLFERFRIIGV
jgi:hypothetical protein